MRLLVIEFGQQSQAGSVEDKLGKRSLSSYFTRLPVSFCINGCSFQYPPVPPDNVHVFRVLSLVLFTQSMLILLTLSLSLILNFILMTMTPKCIF